MRGSSTVKDLYGFRLHRRARPTVRTLGTERAPGSDHTNTAAGRTSPIRTAWGPPPAFSRVAHVRPVPLRERSTPTGARWTPFFGSSGRPRSPSVAPRRLSGVRSALSTPPRTFSMPVRGPSMPVYGRSMSICERSTLVCGPSMPRCSLSMPICTVSMPTRRPSTPICARSMGLHNRPPRPAGGWGAPAEPEPSSTAGMVR